jgi:hypothetical protein
MRCGSPQILLLRGTLILIAVTGESLCTSGPISVDDDNAYKALSENLLYVDVYKLGIVRNIIIRY